MSFTLTEGTDKHKLLERFFGSFYHDPNTTKKNYYFDGFTKFNSPINFVKVESKDAIQINFTNKTTNEGYNVTLYVCEINYGLTKKKVRTFQGHLNKQKNSDKVIIENHNVRYQQRVLAITVGDILRMYYYNNRSKLEEKSNPKTIKNNSLEYNSHSQFEKKIMKFLRAVLSIDSFDNDTMNSFGIYSGGGITEWDLPKYFDSNYMNLGDFCRKKIYLSMGVVSGLFELFLKSNDDPKYKKNIETEVDNIFRGMFGYDVVLKFYKYFNKEGPLEENEEDKTIYFEEPKKLTDICLMMEEYKDSIPYNHQILQAVNRKFNNREKRESQRFSEVVIDDIAELPSGYPIYAFDKVLIKKWDPIKDTSNFIDYLKYEINEQKTCKKLKNLRIEGKTTYVYNGKLFSIGCDCRMCTYTRWTFDDKNKKGEFKEYLNEEYDRAFDPNYLDIMDDFDEEELDEIQT